MNKKIVGICLCTLVVLSSLTTILVSNNGTAEDTPQIFIGDLDYNFMWHNITGH